MQRVPKEHIEAIVEALCRWHPDLSELLQADIDDLVAEFDVAAEGDMDRLKFAKDSETSRKAALFNYPRRGSQRERVLEAVMATKREGLTCDEAEAQLRLTHQAASARMNELREGGFISCKVVDWNRITRKTRSGAEAEVMVATAKPYDQKRKRSVADHFPSAR